MIVKIVIFLKKQDKMFSKFASIHEIRYNSKSENTEYENIFLNEGK